MSQGGNVQITVVPPEFRRNRGGARQSLTQTVRRRYSVHAACSGPTFTGASRKLAPFRFLSAHPQPVTPDLLGKSYNADIINTPN
jgi:hypothetical protein